MFSLIFLPGLLLFTVVRCELTDESLKGLSAVKSINLSDTIIFEEIIVYPNLEVIFKFNEVGNASFIVVQCHSYLYKLKFTHNNGLMNETLEDLSSGFVDTTPTRDDFFIIENSHQFPVVALFAAIPYNDDVPVPGGCNLEFSTEMAPYLRLNQTRDLTTVSVAPAKEITKGSPCNGTDLHYTFFLFYSPQRDFSNATYFDAIRKMMTPETMFQSAVLVPSWEDVALKRLVASYPGTGVTFGCIVRSQSGKYASYVPVHTFGCTYSELDGQCLLQVSVSTPIKVALVFLFVVGIVLNFYGFRCHMFRGYMFTSFLSGVISYVVMYDVSSTSSGFILMSYAIGMLCALIVLILSYKIKWLFTFTQLVTISLFMGALFVFLGSGLYEFRWLSYIGFSLLVGLLFCSMIGMWQGLSASIVGGYLMILPVDFLFGPSLHYILIDIIRACSVEGFTQSFIHPPIQITDMVLISLWWILVAVGVASQTCSTTKRMSESSPLLDHDSYSSRPPSYNETYSYQDPWYHEQYRSQ